MLRVCLAAIFCLSLMSCEDKQDDKVFTAQSCLDHATSSNVDTCVAMINGISTNRASIIRCAADFIRNGIDTNTIVEAIQDLDNGAATNVSATLYSKLVFKDGSSAPDTSRADQAVADCRATASQTLTALAVAASTATVLQQIADAISGGDIGNLDSTNVTTPADLEKIADQVTTLYPVACSDGGPMKGSEACLDITNAATEAGIDLSVPLTDQQKQDLAKKFLDKT